MTVDPGAEADSIPLNETDINTATTNTQNVATSDHMDNANSTTTFVNTNFSTTIENPFYEHPADEEEFEATPTTAHEVCHNACCVTTEQCRYEWMWTSLVLVRNQALTSKMLCSINNYCYHDLCSTLIILVD